MELHQSQELETGRGSKLFASWIQEERNTMDEL